MTTESLPVLAILGGTGDLGTGLARRWAQAGYQVIIGSRTQEKAEAAVADLREVMAERGVSEVTVQAMENLAAAQAADIVTLTVPFSHQASTLELVKPALQGKILIDVTVPLVPPKVARVQLPPQGSAGQIAQELLGEEVAVVVHLHRGQSLDEDALLAFARDRLAGYKVPTRVFFSEQALPRNATNKILKRELKAGLLAAL